MKKPSKITSGTSRLLFLRYKFSREQPFTALNVLVKSFVANYAPMIRHSSSALSARKIKLVTFENQALIPHALEYCMSNSNTFCRKARLESMAFFFCMR